MTERRGLVDAAERMSVRNQCELLGISRSGLYHQCQPETPENLRIMRRLDELHLRHPVYGSRRLTWLLERDGLRVNRKRVMRLLQIMGIEAIYPKARTSETGAGHRIYPYLLKGLEISGPDQVWCADITYIPLQTGFMYLVAVMDWWSRHVLAWEISNTMDTGSACGRGSGRLRPGTGCLTSRTPTRERSSPATYFWTRWKRLARR